MTPVHLRLLARRRFESAHRSRHPCRSLRLQPILQNRTAALVASLPDSAYEHLGIPHAGFQPVFQVRLVRVQLARRRHSRA
jgi:hypothetical protein